MDVPAFRSRMTKLSVFLLIVIVGFPFILSGLVKLTWCEGGDACGAIMVMGGMVFRPLAWGIFVIGVGKGLYQRCVHAKLTRGWIIVVFLWIMGSASFLLGAQNFWGANFGLGLLAIHPPLLLVFFAMFIIFLSVYHGQELGDERGIDLNVAWVLTWLCAGFSLFLNFPAVQEPFIKLVLLFNIVPIPSIVAFNNIIYPLISIPPPLHLALSWVVPVIFSLALLYINFQSRKRRASRMERLELQEQDPA